MERRTLLKKSYQPPRWFGYAAGSVLTAAAGLLRVAADPWLSGVQFITFFPIIVVVAYVFGPGPGLSSAILSALISWYFLIPLRNSFQFAHPAEAYTLLLFVSVGSVIALSLGQARMTARRLARARSALSTSEHRYSRIFHQVHDLIFTTDLGLVVTDCNPATAVALGVPIATIVGSHIGEYLSEEGLGQARQMLKHKLEHGGTTRHDIQVRHSSGELLTWEVSSGLAVDELGEIVGLHAIARDVTEQLHAARRQSLLVHELNHRVKNTLALVQGLAAQSFSDRTDLKTGRLDFQSRISALAKAHDLLTRENWEGATVEDVVQEATAHLGFAPGQICADGPLVRIESKAAVSLAMALHELATNAMKYGALSNGTGQVAIRWTEDDSGGFNLEWKESGGPLVASPTRKGFGLKLLQRVASSEFDSQAVCDFAPEGFSFRMSSRSKQA